MAANNHLSRGKRKGGGGAAAEEEYGRGGLGVEGALGFAAPNPPPPPPAAEGGSGGGGGGGQKGQAANSGGGGGGCWQPARIDLARSYICTQPKTHALNPKP